LYEFGMEQLAKKEIISRLQQNILLLEGYKAQEADTSGLVGLGPIEAAFPNKIFPTAAIHEFITAEPEHAAACAGFISGLLKTMMLKGGACLWISKARTLFPPALKTFGIEPDRIVFVDLKREKDVLWATEEALKCEGLAAVITEVQEISFAQSRRLQLTVEKSRVTGFILRNDQRKLSATPCVARWKITPLPSKTEDDLPGVGFPRWQVELLKVRNGNGGSWQIEWSANGFKPITEAPSIQVIERKLKAG
jgi:protein ImuA